MGFSRFIYCIFLRVSYSHSLFIVSYFKLSLHVFIGFIFVLVFFRFLFLWVGFSVSICCIFLWVS